MRPRKGKRSVRLRIAHARTAATSERLPSDALAVVGVTQRGTRLAVHTVWYLALGTPEGEIRPINDAWKERS
jgi:hypothetical protein